MSRALILVGHGSHLNGDSSAPVYQHAAGIRQTGLFDEVIEAFWKEEPALPDAIDLAESDEILVVPLFLAEGYFTRQVLPRELGLNGAQTQRNGRVVHYLPPVGAHPAMARMILQRAIRDSGLSAEERSRATLVVIGHGTERSATSGDTLYRLLETLRSAGDFGTVDCGFLDESPRIADVIESNTSDSIVLVPFFMAEGWHTSHTIPVDLGLTGPRTRRGSRTFWYTPPVGTLPEIADVVVEMTSPMIDPSAAPSQSVASPATEARQAFLEWLRAAPGGEREFLQLAVRATGDGSFFLRHRDDRDLPPHHLRSITSPEQALEMVRTSNTGRYRPIRSSDDLQRGWSFTTDESADLWRVISVIYPAAVSLWHRARSSRLEVNSYEGWAERQTAMYEVVRNADPDELDEVIAGLCDSCLRTRKWRGAGEIPINAGSAAAEDDVAIVPCCEPCTLFATRVRERVTAARVEG